MSVVSVKLDRVEKIAEAVLYEGYMLYPYRTSSVKNQQRWNFGVLCPCSYSKQQKGSEAWTMQTQCLLQGGPSAQLSVKVCFLQIVDRLICQSVNPTYKIPENTESELDLVDKLEVGGQTYVPWQEAVEREVAPPTLPVADLSFHPPTQFDFPAGRELEPLQNESGEIAGMVVREWKSLFGFIEIYSEPYPDDVFKVMVRIRNLTGYDPPQEQNRADALRYSLVSAHTILTVEDGLFISLLDPPESLKNLASECSNIGTWP